MTHILVYMCQFEMVSHFPRNVALKLNSIIKLYPYGNVIFLNIKNHKYGHIGRERERDHARPRCRSGKIVLDN